MYEYDEERDGKITTEEYNICMEYQIVANESAFDAREAIREQLKSDGVDYIPVLIRINDKFSKLLSEDRFSKMADMIEDLCNKYNIETSPWVDYIKNRNNKTYLRQTVAIGFALPFQPRWKNLQQYYPPRPERRRDTSKKPKQNKTEETRGGGQKNPVQSKEEQTKIQTHPDRTEKVKSTSTQIQSSAVKNEPPVEEVIYRKKKLSELTMADCDEISRKFLRKLYETGTDKVRKLYFCSIQDSKTQKKFMNAITAYAKLVPHEIPILCFDDTFFGGAENGFLVTTHGIHIHNHNETLAKFISFKDIESITLNEGFAQGELVINNEIKAVMMGLDHPEYNNIWVAVNFIKVCLDVYE